MQNYFSIKLIFKKPSLVFISEFSYTWIMEIKQEKSRNTIDYYDYPMMIDYLLSNSIYF